MSFDEEMKRLAVTPVAGARARVPPKPAPERLAAPEPEPVDDETLWKHAIEGALPQGQGVSRPHARPAALPTLDLHGMAEEDALSELRRFITLHRGSRPAWVRVITGRGKRTPAILRRAVANWMRVSSQVASFRPAEPEDGGDGVLLVRLTRKAP